MSVRNSDSELPESTMCKMYGGCGSRCVQILDSELPESVICIMFRGSGPGCVQNSSFEHLRGTIYCKLHRIEAKSTVETEWNRVGRRERRAGGTLISSEDCRILQIEDRRILRLILTRLEPRRGRRIVYAAHRPADPVYLYRSDLEITQMKESFCLGRAFGAPDGR